MRLLEWLVRISVNISWGTTIGNGHIRTMGVWLLPELNNNLKWRLVFIDHYNDAFQRTGLQQKVSPKISWPNNVPPNGELGLKNLKLFPHVAKK